ncbi:MAG: tRNA dihydrouridine synthase DusB [Erysipelotrichaceae bacterium]|nr:tRNA dihydrouridine synthase DusB [Erysipelotrichaceae bacterium]
MMLELRELLKKNPIIAAPLAGISNAAYQSLCLDYGCGLVYTEMISAEGIFFHNQRTLEMCSVPKGNHPIALQLFGAKVDHLVAAAQYIDQKTDADVIDLNMGCPAPKVVKTGAGSALLKDPEKAFAIVSGIRQAVRKPVSVKMRLGFSDSEKKYLSFAKGLEEAGADMIAVHGRTRTQMYQGSADWDAIREIKAELHIPVIGNGDVRTAEDFFARKEESGVDAVMIGRGLLGNPFLIRQIVKKQNGETDLTITPKERFAACRDHAQRLIALSGEDRALRELRGIVGNYLRGLPEASYYRGKVTTLRDYEELDQLLKEFQLRLEERNEDRTA